MRESTSRRLPEAWWEQRGGLDPYPVPRCKPRSSALGCGTTECRPAPVIHSTTEVARSAALPQGALEFQLNNLDQLQGVDPGNSAGRRVQVKGVLNGSGASARIYVLSLADTGQACG
jgi:hypothetical protein